MGISADAYLLVGCEPEESGLNDDEMEELRSNSDYGIHGSYFTGDEYFIGIQVKTSDLTKTDWFDKYNSLRIRASNELKCDIDKITLRLDVLWN